MPRRSDERMNRIRELVRNFEYTRVCFYNSYDRFKTIYVFLVNDKTQRYVAFSTNWALSGHGSFSFLLDRLDLTRRAVHEERHGNSWSNIPQELREAAEGIYGHLPQNKLASLGKMIVEGIVPNHRIPVFFQCSNLEEAIEIISNNRRNRTHVTDRLTDWASGSVRHIQYMDRVNKGGEI